MGQETWRFLKSMMKMVANGGDEYRESEFLIKAHPLKHQNDIVPCILTFFCSPSK